MALSEDWRREMLMEYGAGAADVEVCRKLAITSKEFDRLYKNDGEFESLVDHGRMLSKAWWYTIGRKNVGSKVFQHPLWYANMKNRFGWSDKMENVQKDGRDINDMSEDELRQSLMEMMPGVVKMLQSQQPDLDVREFLNDRSSRAS